jgi:hypothetical protein
MTAAPEPEEIHEIAIASADAAEGRASFAERRKPLFRGW